MNIINKEIKITPNNIKNERYFIFFFHTKQWDTIYFIFKKTLNVECNMFSISFFIHSTKQTLA